MSLNNLSNGAVWFVVAVCIAVPALAVWAAYELGTLLP